MSYIVVFVYIKVIGSNNNLVISTPHLKSVVSFAHLSQGQNVLYNRASKRPNITANVYALVKKTTK